MSETPSHSPEDQKIIDDLTRKVDDQQKAMEELRKENDSLRNALDKLRKEFEDYKVRHPATVGMKNGKPYFYQESKPPETDSREKVKKRPGARMGHKGYHRQLPDHIDEERVATLSSCPECGSDLGDPVEIRTRIIEDVPPVRPVVIRYSIRRYYCSRCRKNVEPEIGDALPGASLSLRTMLIAAYMKTAERLPAARVSEIMGELFALPVSRGEIMNIVRLLSRHLGSRYRNLVRRIRRAKARYVDETSWRIDGENRYMWAFITESEALYVPGPRSHEVPLRVLGKHDGIDMHDGFSAYEKLASITHNRQAWCWSHMIKDAEELIQYHGPEGRYILSTLKHAYDRARDLRKIPPGEITGKMLEDLYCDFLKIDVPYESKKCSGFVRNLLKRKRDDLFRFVIDRSVDPTNNRAERGIRPIVTYRKVSGGSRSGKGARDFARIYSILESDRKKGKLPFRADPG